MLMSGWIDLKEVACHVSAPCSLQIAAHLELRVQKRLVPSLSGSPAGSSQLHSAHSLAAADLLDWLALLPVQSRAEV
jgi:hypothetical protein